MLDMIARRIGASTSTVTQNQDYRVLWLEMSSGVRGLIKNNNGDLEIISDLVNPSDWAVQKIVVDLPVQVFP